MYIAVICRPDILWSVNQIARRITKCTENVVRACKRIAGFLKATKHQGLEYSPEIERNFRAQYSEGLSKQGKQLGDTVAFSDADFAGDSVSLRSTSGGVLFRRGTPICW